ncbi:class I adenylate-forming enzyme family protein [Effusibacillus dendaii]|uniref:Long-chain-fatty-acid--CoA ligase n=1 Tax=Effusibacillus dendaii TaxID=2743772 RepID=A0A7I8DAH3_9BACL|nr:long-chain-fatty-acid--CoA ligase [Effusibacillus dendaii]BCJ85959.1 long-chain-fatty-acid--CoA ligase [Effusibacillus dendaii]
MNLAFSVEFQAVKRGKQTAVIFDDVNYDYDYMNNLSNQFALTLRDLGVGKGDRVSIWLPNGLSFIGAFFGILKLGALAVPMNVLLKEAEISHVLADAEVKVLITHSTHFPILNHVIENLPNLETVIFTDDHKESVIESEKFKFFSFIKRESDSPFLAIDLSPDDAATILYTSGTTGLPKGVVLTHYNLQSNAEFYADHIQLTDKHFGCIVTPLSHLLVLMAGLILIFLKGGRFLLFEKFEKEYVARKIKELGINFFIGVPAMYYMFLSLPEKEEFDLSSLEICITSGAQMPLEVRKRFEERFRTFTIQAYGQTEASPVISVDRLDMQRKFESVGYPMSHLEVKIVDPTGNEVPRGSTGEIIAKGHCVMKEYWRNPEATRSTVKDGWLHTGDIGYMDEDGYLHLKDRIKEVIIVGGYNVYPAEVENVIYQHPAVLEAAVIGVTDQRLGEIPKAFIVKKRGVDVSKEEIIQFCSSKLARYKVMREVEFIDEIPKTVTGKLLKRKLKEQYTSSQY